jgi:hypothetical protein
MSASRKVKRAVGKGVREVFNIKKGAESYLLSEKRKFQLAGKWYNFAITFDASSIQGERCHEI